MQKKNILILCTGNSCRSQIAEGWGNALCGNRAQFRSAGIEAHGKNPRAIQIMQESEVDISGQESSILTDEMLAWADIVITVCGHADELCPSIPLNTEKRHVPFDDPAKVSGTEEEIMREFRRVRDEIRQYIVNLNEELHSDSLSL